MMKFQTKWLAARWRSLWRTAAAAGHGGERKVKSINAENKTFVLTDAADKEFTFKLGDDLVINRAGKGRQSD